MGLNINGTQCILYAKKAGLDFSRTALIGRQSLYITASDLQKNLKKFGFSADNETIRHITGNNRHSEDFFRFLGAETVDSFDYSDYEGANCLQDMNEPIHSRYRQQYSVVLDSGTLEHVFNFPIAIKNCMEMVMEGGYYIGITPANNFMGHGFYQFSPELFFSIFTDANGYDLISLIAYEDRPDSEWYRVISPDSAQCRITLCNSRSTYLFIMARKIKNIEPFKTVPQQSDYVLAWNGKNNRSKNMGGNKRNILTTTLLRLIPKSIKQGARQLLRLDKLGKPLERFDYLGFNPKYYQPIKSADWTAHRMFQEKSEPDHI